MSAWCAGRPDHRALGCGQRQRLAGSAVYSHRGGTVRLACGCDGRHRRPSGTARLHPGQLLPAAVWSRSVRAAAVQLGVEGSKSDLPQHDTQHRPPTPLRLAGDGPQVGRVRRPRGSQSLRSLSCFRVYKQVCRHPPASLSCGALRSVACQTCWTRIAVSA